MIPDFARLVASIFTNDRSFLSVQIRQNQGNLSFSIPNEIEKCDGVSGTSIAYLPPKLTS